MNKRKVLNDPVHGFISIPYNVIFQIIEHPYFQRLRRIKQLALTDYVYPGAIHTRFHHALGAFHLMGKAIFTLRSKGVEITEDEEQGALIAILLHDIGHGPFSHTLEHCLMDDVSHEEISIEYMRRLNEIFDGKLDTAISIFEHTYPKKFLHQLVSSQLDVDRLDYLTRDSFFTGVSEGIVNYNRILDMIDVRNDELVVEAKGIYSIEKFLISRRIMYWQVYLHKTVVCAEELLVKTMERARFLTKEGNAPKCSSALAYFLKNGIKADDLKNDKVIEQFSLLDDIDIMSAIKDWMTHEDEVLSFLSKSLINRNLFRIKVLDEPPKKKKLDKIRASVKAWSKLKDEDLDYIVFANKMTNYLYHPEQTTINILKKSGKIVDLGKASDQWEFSDLVHPVSKYYICYPKNIE